MRSTLSRYIFNAILLAAFLLSAGEGARSAEAKPLPVKELSPLVLIIMAPDIPSSICAGQKLKLEFSVGNYYNGPPKLRYYTVDVTITSSQGKVNPGKFSYPHVIRNKAFVNSFTYKAPKKKGTDTVTIEAIMDKNKATITLPFNIKECKFSLTHSESNTLAGGGWTILNTYSGSGALSVDENGSITGSGSESVYGEVMPFSAEGVSCTFSPPWEGSAAVAFSGTKSDDGSDSVTMDIDDLSVNSTTMTCSGGDSSGSTTWPGYTYGACQVQLADISFDAATIDVPFNCPGSDPYSVSITIAPRSQS